MTIDHSLLMIGLIYDLLSRTLVPSWTGTKNHPALRVKENLVRVGSQPAVGGAFGLWTNLNENSGAVVAVATVLLAVLTGIYVWLLLKQSRRLEEQDKQRVIRAARMLFMEVLFNERGTAGGEQFVFLDTAYSYSAWALPEIPMSLDSARAVCDAYMSVRSYHAVLDPKTLGHTITSEALRRAQAAIKNAARALKEDRQFLAFIGPELAKRTTLPDV